MKSWRAVFAHLLVRAGILSILCSITGCATVTRDRRTIVAVRSEPAGATIYLDGVRQTVPTPAMVALSRTRHDIGLEKGNCIGQQVVVDTAVSRPLLLYLVPDVLMLGVGVPIDMIFGGFLELEPRQILVRLEESPAEQPVRQDPCLAALRPRTPAGMGLIYVYHANPLPGGAKLFVRIRSTGTSSAPDLTDMEEAEVTMDAPVSFPVVPGRYIVEFRKLGVPETLRVETLVQMGEVSYVRGMSTGTAMEVGGVPRVKWDFEVDAVAEREALTDLYYFSNFQNAPTISNFLPPPCVWRATNTESSQ